MAYLMKLGYQVLMEEERLWVQVVRHKYWREEGTRQIQLSSHSWKSIRAGMDVARQGMGWRIGNGRRIKFWTDRWLGNFTLDDLCVRELADTERSKIVADYWDRQSGWDWDRLRDLLGETDLHLLSPVVVSGEEDNEDKLVWMLSPNGKFSCKSAVELLRAQDREENMHQGNRDWERIWDMKGPQRNRVFLWLVRQGRLLTNKAKHERGMTVSPMCPICHREEETVLHAVRDCRWARTIWQKMIFPHEEQVFFTSDLETWVDVNLSENLGQLVGHWDWKNIFVETLHSVWAWHNSYTHREAEGVQEEGNISAVSLPDPLGAIAVRTMMNRQVQESGVENNMALRLVGWEPPDPGWMKVNMDASVRTSSRDASVGGLLRAPSGQWEEGFYGRIGRAPILTAELWAIWYGLDLARKKGVARVLVESDAVEAVQAILTREVTQPQFNLVESMRCLMGCFMEVRVQHIPREANQAADCLAHMEGVESQNGICSVVELPEPLFPYLLQDSKADAWPRLMTIRPRFVGPNEHYN